MIKDEARFAWYENETETIGITSLAKLAIGGGTPRGPEKIGIELPNGEHHIFVYQHDIKSRDEHYTSQLIGLYKSGNNVLYVHYC